MIYKKLNKAFPSKPPTEDIKKEYAYIFLLKNKLPNRFLKLMFDKLSSIFFLLFAFPIVILLKVAFVIEGVLIPENKGPMFFSYNAVSQGKVFPKYKIRLIKTQY